MPEAGVWCFILCFGSIEAEKPKVVDSYCSSYSQVVRSAEDLGWVKNLPRVVRDRMQGNDLEYLCRCRRLGIKACQNRVKAQK